MTDVPLTSIDVARLVVAARESGVEVVSVLATEGRSAGARVVVSKAGAIEGTLGSTELDAAARECATQVFASRQPTFTNGLFAELHVPIEQLFIFGAGHIAVPLAQLGVLLGFDVTVLDDRTEFASETRFAPGVSVRLLQLKAPFDGLAMGTRCYVVLVTRAHEHDFDLLSVLLQREALPHYIGMIGSRRRVRAAFTALLNGGVPKEKLEHIRAPVGLDIGAETPAEIALSIAAELVAARHGHVTSESIANQERVLERFFERD